MSKVYFFNNEAINLRMFTTMGVNAKTSNDAIGFFGTGLKYALAVLARLGQKVTIQIQEENLYTEFELRKETSNLRGKDFEFLSLVSTYSSVGIQENIPLPMTTEYGKNWELWEAYRELYSNTLDEKGIVSDYETEEKTGQINAAMKNTRFFTYIIVEGDAFTKVHKNKEAYFPDFSKKKLAFSTPNVDIYYGASDAIFYRGINVGTLQHPCAYTYNIKSSITLSENRKYQYAWDILGKIAYSVVAHDNQAHIYLYFDNIMKACLHNTFMEDSLSFRSYVASPEAIEAIHALKAARAHLSKNLYEFYMEHKPKEAKQYVNADLTTMQSKLVQRAIRILKNNGVIVPTDKLIVTDDVAVSVLGFYDKSIEQIVISTRVFEKGITHVVGTILEEYLHMSHGFRDESREFQDYLIDMCANLMINGEE